MAGRLRSIGLVEVDIHRFTEQRPIDGAKPSKLAQCIGGENDPSLHRARVVSIETSFNTSDRNMSNDTGDARPQLKRCRSTRPFAASSGAHRSPSRRTRAGTLSMRKSSITTPRSTSAQVTGVDTAARGVGRTE